jgi:lysophospholipase L1-like esterase
MNHRDRKDRAEPRRRRTVSSWTAGLVSAAATFLALELLLRVFDPLGMKYFAEADRYFSTMKPDPSFAYIHPANYRGVFEDAPVSINSHGFRAPEWQVAKPAGLLRLMILGDSVVFGWGAPQDSIFSARLQKKFDADGARVEVIAAGVGSWNTRTEYEYLKTRGLEFEPDVVLLVATNNDIVPNLGGRTDVDKTLLSESGGRPGGVGLWAGKAWRYAGKRSCVLRHVQYFSRRRAETREKAAATTDSPMWEDARAALGGIVDLSRSRGFSVVVCLYTCETKLGDDGVLALYKKTLSTLGVPCFTLPETLFNRREYRNSFVDGHANARGHALIADRIYDVASPIASRKLKESDARGVDPETILGGTR